MSTKRFVVEGEWSGYTSAQQRVVHRTVETYWRDGYERIRSHNFSDGTYLAVRVRDALPRERVVEIHGYDKLLREAAFTEFERFKQERAKPLPSRAGG